MGYEKEIEFILQDEGLKELYTKLLKRRMELEELSMQAQIRALKQSVIDMEKREESKNIPLPEKF